MINLIWFLILLFWATVAYTGGYDDGTTDQQMKNKRRFAESPRAEFRENLREWSNPDQRYKIQKARLLTKLAELERQHDEIQPQKSLQ